MSAQVHAPYHFVPLSKWVYLPDWAHLVSHDHPFRDGLSGSIEISLANKTPLLVGAESPSKKGSPTLVTWTRTPDGTPVIPGSSLKGMLRSFLETATFAKFKQVDDNRYTYRNKRGVKTDYASSVAELAQSQQANQIDNDASFDLCELMFGTLREHGIGLKSRVSFSDSICSSTSNVKKSSPVILGQPKASYLNAYLEQNHNNGDVRGELTMYAPGAKLAGWKRYPIQARFNAHLPKDLEDSVDLQSQLELLDPGAEFSGKIVFHNLKPVELGALLWALDPGEKFYHGLGHGKSLGAGAVKLQAELNLLHSNDASNPDAQTLIQRFVEHMDSQYPAKNANDHSWQNSAQLQHLLAFGDMEDNQKKNLTYMPLQKGAATVTYSNSKVSGSRRALPSWQAGDQSLSRTEEIDTSSGYAPRGRLAELVDKLVQDSTQLESMQTAVKKLQEEQSKQAMAAQKEAASPLFKQFLELVEHFEIYRGSNGDDAMNQIISRHGDLTKLLEQAVTAQSGLSNQEVKEMLSVVNEFALTRYFDVTVKVKDLSKKQKPRHQQKQTLLTQLAELC